MVSLEFFFVVMVHFSFYMLSILYKELKSCYSNNYAMLLFIICNRFKNIIYWESIVLSNYEIITFK